MKPIDLLTYAHYSEKISSKELSPAREHKVQLWRILGAHVLDLAASFMIATCMSVMFNQVVKMLLLTKGLKSIYSEALTLGLAAPILPLVMMSYFFLCNFLNNGQTYGMHTFKIRMKLNEQNYTQSFTWSVYSTLLSFSCGLFYFIKPSLWENIKGHDYLYVNLFDHKEVSPVSLINETNDVKASVEEKEFSMAA